MPSTVKVRIKSARNLPVMDNNHPKQQTTAAANTNGNTNTNRSTATSVSSNKALIGKSISSMSMSMVGIAAPPSTDAYVVVTLGGHVNLTDQEEESSKQKRYTQKTKVCRRTLHPVWDEGVW
jgi:hypothetical protein